MKLLLFLLLPFSMTAQNAESNNSQTTKAITFINSLTDAQKNKALYPFDEMTRYEWHYVPGSMIPRTGITIKDMDSTQKKNIHELLREFLSREGYNRTVNIMDLEYILKELEPTNSHRIPENYFVSIYGMPDKDSTWGWKFTGHHLTLNFTIVKNKVAFAPFFFGTNPAEVKQGPKKGLRIIKDEEDLGFELVNSLTTIQKQKAIFQLKAFSDIVTTNAQQVNRLNDAGIMAKDLIVEQKIILNKLIAAYLLSMQKTIAEKRMKRIVKEDINDIRFGWAGGLERGKPHYYRIQGKTFLIEFDNTQNNANHIHTVWRDFNGDFGVDLLREHYHNSKHHQ